jgi:queuine tRNA-ribosyltransferase
MPILLENKINYPLFMPDATRGFIKTLAVADLIRSGIKGLVVNTYHLLLRPGTEIIKKAGGIHKFIDWPGFILSDSGGYQIFSLIHKNPKLGKITDEKAIFKSPLDGSLIEMTPEKAIKIQFDLGVDAMVCLDDCPPNDYNKKEIEKAMERTIKWAERCAREYEKQLKKKKTIKGGKAARPLIFSVIQGGPYLDLRKKCIKGLMKVAPKTSWDGYGFGGRHIDGKGMLMEKVLKYTADLIPENKCRFALGIGTPEDIVKCARMGWQLFDCVIPTREARHGKLYFFKGSLNCKHLNIANAKFAKDFSPINPDSNLPELKNYTKSYLHHLFRFKEPLGQRLASLNNLEFYAELVKKLK